ncbi:MAG: hypothetical protein ABI855_08310 [Bacteroidota bacterium]
MISSILLQTVVSLPDTTLAKISISTGNCINGIEYVVMAIWCALMFTFLYFLGRRYTFGNWTVQNPNPYKDETLAMPKGTFRGIITLTVLFFAIIIELHVIENPLIEYWSEKYITAFQMVLAFYFGSQIMNGLSKDEVKINTANPNPANPNSANPAGGNTDAPGS